MELASTLLAITIIILMVLLYQMNRMWQAVRWILMHVQVVSKRDQQDPELVRVKQMFGIEEKEEHGK